jgi:hypothetical protein
MENTNQIGIWMDHSAYLMEFNTMPFEIQIIECDLTVDEKK